MLWSGGFVCCSPETSDVLSSMLDEDKGLLSVVMVGSCGSCWVFFDFKPEEGF
jgi:hypothetical protein